MIRLASIDLKREKIDTLLIPVCEDKPLHTDAAIRALAESALGLEEFRGKPDQEVILYNPPGLSIKRAVFRGMGKAAKLDAEGLRQMAGKSLTRCAKMGVARLWVAVPQAAGLGLDPSCRPHGPARRRPAGQSRFRPLQTGKRDQAPRPDRLPRPGRTRPPVSKARHPDRNRLPRHHPRPGVGQHALQ